MELKIKHGFSKTIITSIDNEPLFIIKNNSFFSDEKTIFNSDGSPAYSIRNDLKPLDHRKKYIFTDHSTKNEFYAWVDRDVFKSSLSGSICRYLFSSLLEIYIDAESFFGELHIKRSGIAKFDILINGNKRGTITNKKISCDVIDDASLLSVLYAFSSYIVNGEELCRTEYAI